jgi:hypothetical protein
MSIMPNRSHTHVISDRAVSSVMAIINECGFAVETVHHDYGEDLFVQTKLDTQVDPHRIWIQVKGTEDPSRFITKKDGLHLKISEDHAFRWIRSPELVVVVLWDVRANKGWWSLPSTSLSEWSIRVECNVGPRLPFAENAVFNRAAMERLAWFSRIDHYHGLIVKAEAAMADAAHMGRVHSNRLLLICFDFLRILDIIQDECICHEFLNDYRNCLSKGLPNWDETEDGPVEKGILALLLLTRINDLCKHGLPISIVENCTQLLYEMLLDTIDLNTGAFVTNG